ncbi:MAG: iron-containing alcohol dehydrogenase [Lentisphaerae bacterium]|nr:iron-containing alcohol dehydrogenase [Lentisphaerota bacterium]
MNPFEGNLYLTGFMGTGKSTLAQALGQALRRSVVDMDAELTRHFGAPIAEVFREQGEGVFREAESALLGRLSRRQRLVVACGGGVPVDPANRALMRRSGRIVALLGDPAALRARLDGAAIAARPLWGDAAAVQALWSARQAAYADHDLGLDAVGMELSAKVEAVLSHLLPDQRLPVVLEGRESPVLATVAAPSALRAPAAGRRVALLTDGHVAARHLARYREALPGAVEIVVPPGEASKSLRRAEAVYQALLAARLERRDLLVALGGGVVTDIGGFVAATWKRGMDCILVSTSLLGCVDAAVGGKSAVNIAGSKNQVGLFTTPRQVILDLAALSTLPGSARREGLIEAYKTGLALRPELAAFIETRRRPLLAGDLPDVAAVAIASAAAKGAVVTEDFREMGLRRVLNLGHTYGHAVEGWHRCRVSHGRCVAVGLRVSLELSRRRGLIDEALAERAAATLRALSPRRCALPTADEAWPLMLHDKKAAAGRLVFVLLAGLGRHICVDDVTPEELALAVEAVQRREDES